MSHTTNNPLVSIVTVSFNQRQYLEEAILSVLNQTYENIEYIVFDGGSTDGSIDLINKYRDCFRHVHVGPDGGAAAALNAGFLLAKGTIYAYLNSDDVLLPTAVEEWVKTFQNNPEKHVCFGDIEIIDEKGAPRTMPGKKVSTFLAIPFSARSYAAGACVIPQQAAAWRAEVFHTVGGFSPENVSCWDYEFFVDATVKKFGFVHIPKVLGKFRVHGQSISGTNRNQAGRIRDHKRIRQKWNTAGYQISKIECEIRLRASQIQRILRQLFT